MPGAYIVALELVSRVDIDVEADSEEDAIQKAFAKFDANFESNYSVEVKHGEWDAEIVQGPEQTQGEEPPRRTAADWRKPSSAYPELAPRTERPPDEEIFSNVWGAFGTSYIWWETGAMTNINPDTMDAEDGWSMEVTLGVEDEGPVIKGVLNADVIWRAICQIAALEVGASADCITQCLRARNSMLDYGGGTVVYDTVAWDQVDFDQPTSDEVMQVAVAGKVIW